MSCLDAVQDVCANCGKTGSENLKLKICTACYLVKYCSVDCQKAHRKQHKRACKKRATERKGGESKADVSMKITDEYPIRFAFNHDVLVRGTTRREEDLCPICYLPSKCIHNCRRLNFFPYLPCLFYFYLHVPVIMRRVFKGYSECVASKQVSIIIRAFYSQQLTMT